MTSKLKEYGADGSLLLISLIWGSTFIVIKKTVELFEPITFVGVRFCLAFLIMLVLCWPRRSKMNRALLKDGLIIGLTLFLVFTFQTLALKFAKAAEVGFLTGLYVLFVPVLSAIFLHKHPHPLSWIGVFFSACGMMLITSGSMSFSTGEIFAVINAFFIGVQIILTDIYSRKHDTVLLTAVEIGVVGILSLVYAYTFEHPDMSGLAEPFVLKSLIFNAVVATVFCFFIQMHMQQYTTPTKAAIMYTMEPISSAFFSFLIGNEILSGRQYSGAFMIVAAILVAEAGTYLRLHKKR